MPDRDYDGAGPIIKCELVGGPNKITSIWYIVLTLGMVLTPLGARAGNSVSVANVLAQPEAFHAHDVLFSGTVRDLIIFPKTDEDLPMNPDGRGHLGLPNRCYFVRPAYKFTLDDGAGPIIEDELVGRPNKITSPSYA